MGKNDLKNKVKSAGADAARTSLFGSLDDYVSASAAEKETPKDTAPAQIETPAETKPRTSAVKASAPARAKAPAPAEPEVAPAEMDDEDLFETYTFYTQPQIEAIRIMAFNSGLDISQIVRDIMDEAIPDDIMEQAIERVKAGKVKQPRKKRRK